MRTKVYDIVSISSSFTGNTNERIKTSCLAPFFVESKGYECVALLFSCCFCHAGIDRK